MNCKNCGKSLSSADKFCSSCGCRNDYYLTNSDVYPNYNLDNQIQQQYSNSSQFQNINQETQAKRETKAYAVLAIVFGILGGLLGLAMGIVGLLKYKGNGYKSERIMCWIGIILWGIWVVIGIVIRAAIIASSVSA